MGLFHQRGHPTIGNDTAQSGSVCHKELQQSTRVITKKKMEQLQWPTSLGQRRKQRRLINKYKIQNGTTAIPIPDCIQRQTTSSTRQYHPIKFRVMKANNNVYKYSFFSTNHSWLEHTLTKCSQCHKSWKLQSSYLKWHLIFL